MGRCQYIFRKGPYVGEKCLRCCEGDFCVEHYTKDVQPILKVPDKSKKNVDLFEIQMQIKKLENECSKCLRLYHGYAIRIDPDHKIPVRRKILKEMQSQEFINNCREEYNELDLESQQRYGYFKGYLKIAREKYLLYPNTYINVIPFNGTIDEAKKRLETVAIKYENCRQHIISLKKYLMEKNKDNDSNSHEDACRNKADSKIKEKSLKEVVDY